MEFVPLNLDITKKVGNRKREGECFVKLGEDYFKTGNFQEAAENFEQYARICKELEDRAGEGSAYGKLGGTYNSIGSVEKALECFEKQLAIARKVGDKKSERRACSSFGSIFQGWRNYNEYHKKHLEGAIESGDKAGEGHAYGNLGMVFDRVGDRAKAIEYLELNLAIVKELGDRVGERTVCGNLGRVHHGLKNFERAIEYHEMQLSIAEEEKCEIDEARAYYHKGCNLESLESLKEALACYKSSARLCNNIRASLQSRKNNVFTDEWKINLFDEFNPVYIALCRTLLKLDFVLEALWAVEQGRAQALAHAIQSRYGIQTYQLKQDDAVSDVCKHISTNTIFFAIDNDIMYIWLLTPDQGVRFEKIAFPPAVHPAAFRNLYARHRFQETVSSAVSRNDNKTEMFRALYDVTIGPIVNQLKGDELVIIPCGPLWFLPFAAFVDPDSKYLHESLRTRLAPSLTTLKLITDCPQGYHRESGAVLLGDPEIPPEVAYRGRLSTVSRIPFARKEVEMIGKLINTQPLTGENATKMALLNGLKNAALVHIASYGSAERGEIFLAKKKPTRPNAVPCMEGDGVLTVEDVLKLRAKPLLVVLSCCHSGRGMSKAAEGTTGIARAFLAAGARSVLVALWAIEDKATFKFMGSFYYHLAEGRRSSEALNKAMKRLRESERFSKVEQWAPFVLMGDDVTLEFLQKPPMRLSVSKVYGPIFIPQSIACQDTFFPSKMYFQPRHSLECSSYSSY